MIDRHSKDKTVYLEVNEATKDVIHLVPSYGLDAWKKEKAAKNLAAATSISKRRYNDV